MDAANASFFVLTISTFDHNMYLVIKMEINCFKAIIHTRENKEFLFPTLRICRIISGEFDWQIGKNTLPVKRGDIVLLNNLIPRKIINTKAVKIEIEVFEFSPAYILNRKLLPGIFYSEDPVVVPREHQKIIGKLLLILSETHKTIPDPEFSGHIMQAVFDLLKKDAKNFATDSKHSVVVFKAVSFIWEHYCEDISVLAVAEYLNISKNHLEKIFKDVYHIGVGAYIRIIRVYKVRSLLEEDHERSVLDIAYACGFNSSSGFYKAYKAVTGENPRGNAAES